MSCAVEVCGASVSYRGHVALRDVSLDIHRGDFVGIVGPNGAGKTTLLTVINGLGRLHSGTVRVFGEPAGPSNFTRLRRRIGYVPQHLHVDPRAPVSCFEAVLLGRYGRIGPFRHPSRADREVAMQMMALTGIGHLAERPVGRISGGEARKISLARALTQQPELLLLDEPTVNLDPPSVGDIIALIGDVYRRFDLTVAMVTHQLDHLPPVCNRVIRMEAGRLTAADLPAHRHD